jgi:integral membrane protein
MMRLLSSPLGRLRVIGLVEGSSFLLLLFIAMPLKYLAGMPQYVSVIGMAHGVLWVAYLASVGEVWMALSWKWQRCAVAVVASILPFGPFVFERSLKAEQEAREAAAAARQPTLHQAA